MSWQVTGTLPETEDSSKRRPKLWTKYRPFNKKYEEIREDTEYGHNYESRVTDMNHKSQVIRTWLRAMMCDNLT